MKEPKTRSDTNFRVTTEQIARLERGLLSLRESNRASPKAVEAIAAVQYQEILRLRAELDVAMGFSEDGLTPRSNGGGPD